MARTARSVLKGHGPNPGSTHATCGGEYPQGGLKTKSSMNWTKKRTTGAMISQSKSFCVTILAIYYIVSGKVCFAKTVTIPAIGQEEVSFVPEIIGYGIL